MVRADPEKLHTTPERGSELYIPCGGNRIVRKDSDG